MKADSGLSLTIKILCLCILFVAYINIWNSFKAIIRNDYLHDTVLFIAIMMLNWWPSMVDYAPTLRSQGRVSVSWFVWLMVGNYTETEFPVFAYGYLHNHWNAF